MMRRVDRSQRVADLMAGQLDLLRWRMPEKVGVLELAGTASNVQEARRATFAHYGMQVVLDELSARAELCTPATMDDYDLVLFSCTAPTDILSVIHEVPREHKCRLVVGGQGCYPIWLLREYADRIFFGRAEGVCDEAILGDGCHGHMWRPGGTSYTIRQAARLLPGESSVGCQLKCKFCQYSHTRRWSRCKGSAYTAGSIGARVLEDTWYSLHIQRPGRYTTALDGWSQETRRKIGKGVKDEQIVEKLSRVVETIDGTAVIKVFQIIGYPWETPESVAEDIRRMGELLSRIRHGRGRVVLLFMVTPFSPEPLTPMEDDPASLVCWRDFLVESNLRAVCSTAQCEAFILPQINSPLTLLKRIAINRGMEETEIRDLAKIRGTWREIADLVTGRWGWIARGGAGRRVSEYLAPVPR